MEQLVKKLLSLGASEAEIVETRIRRVHAPFKMDELGPIASAEKTVYGIRVVYDKRIAYTIYTGSPEGLESVLERALAAAKASTKLEDRPGLPNDQNKASVSGLYSESILRIVEGDYEPIVDLVKRIRSKASEEGIDLARSNVDFYEIQRRIVNSSGIDKSSKETMAAVVIQALYGKGSAREFEVSRSLEINVEEVVARGAKKAKDGDKAELVETFKGLAIFEPEMAAELIGIMFGSSIRGDQVLKGASPLKDKLGKQIASKDFELHDDATLASGIASREFDDEGVAGQDTLIVSEGVLRAFIYDHYRGSKAGKQSTGNFIASREDRPPSVSPTNLVLKPVKGSLDDLISEVDKGLLISSTIGARLSDPIGGIYNATVTLGYLVENGEIKKPVKGLVVNIPFRESLKEIRIGAEPVRPYMVMGVAYAPPVILPNATFAAKS